MNILEIAKESGAFGAYTDLNHSKLYTIFKDAELEAFAAAVIEDYKESLDAVRRHRSTYEVIIGEQDTKIAHLQNENLKLREALEFYGDRNIYAFNLDKEFIMTDIGEDCGIIARGALSTPTSSLPKELL